jgi:dephospho-CoA kinase
MKLGLTGLAASGKSSVLDLFKQHGWKTLNADALVHEIYDCDASIREGLAKHFGREVLNAEGQIRMEWLAQRIYENSLDRIWLEDLIHPRVRSLWQEAMVNAPKLNWIVEVPLLFEKAFECDFEKTLFVYTSQNILRDRLKARGWSSVRIESVLALQRDNDKKANKGDYVFLNESSPEVLEQQVKVFLSSLD